MAITGLGLLTPLGRCVEENWTHVLAKTTGIVQYQNSGRPRAFQCIGKVRSVHLPENVAPKLSSEMRFLNRGAMLGFVAACEAVRNSGISLSDIPPSRRALYIASGDLTKTGYEFMYPATEEATTSWTAEIDSKKLNRAALEQVSPSFLLESLANNLFSFLAGHFACMGPNTGLASLSPWGSLALELAFRSVKHGRADMALVVAYGNWITEIPLCELEELGLLSRCASGPRSFQPYDRSRDGFIPGEGGAALVLESADIAARRRAAILAWVQGCGNGIEHPTGSGFGVPPRVALRSISQSLEEARFDPDDLAFCIGHGSATRKGDQAELQSITEVLGTAKAAIPISALKPYTGHMGAASDLAEVILGIKAIQQQIAPATLNFVQADKDFMALRILKDHQPCKKTAFLSISYGFGGQSSSIVVSAQ